MLVRTANARNRRIPSDSIGVYGLRTVDYGLRTPGSSELLGSPVFVVYREPGTCSVEYDQGRAIKSFSVASNTPFIVRNNRKQHSAYVTKHVRQHIARYATTPCDLKQSGNNLPATYP
jgi:hypothetical protein